MSNQTGRFGGGDNLAGKLLTRAGPLKDNKEERFPPVPPDSPSIPAQSSGLSGFSWIFRLKFV